MILADCRTAKYNRADRKVFLLNLCLFSAFTLDQNVAICNIYAYGSTAAFRRSYKASRRFVFSSVSFTEKGAPVGSDLANIETFPQCTNVQFRLILASKNASNWGE